MDAHVVYGKLRPRSLIVDHGGQSAARNFIDELEHMRRANQWQRLDDLAQSASELDTDPHCPVLILLLADAYTANRIPRRAEVLAQEALRLLQCRAKPGCLQNQAVAGLYVALAHHAMNRLSDCLAGYHRAAEQFRIAQSAWHANDPLDASVAECGGAAHDVEAVAHRLLASTTRGPIPAHGGPSWSPPHVTPTAPLSPAPVPDRLYAHYWMVYVLGLIAWIVWFVVAGVVADTVATWFLADTAAGRLAVPAALAAYVAFGLGLVLGALIWTRQSFVYKVRPGQTAIIEEGGRLLTVPAEETRWLLPWYDRLQAFVPTKDVAVTLPEQTVLLGSGPFPVRVHVKYVVHDVIGFYSRVSSALSAQARPIEAKRYGEEWDGQLAVYLNPLLASQLVGATRSDLLQHKVAIEDNLQNELAGKANHWCVQIQDLSVHPVH